MSNVSLHLSKRFLDSLLTRCFRSKTVYLVPWDRFRPKKDTVLAEICDLGSGPNLYLVETKRWFPGGPEVQAHPCGIGDELSFTFTTLDGEPVSIEVPSRGSGGTIHIDFDRPE